MWTDGLILPEPFTNLLTSDFDENKYNDEDDIEVCQMCILMHWVLRIMMIELFC